MYNKFMELFQIQFKKITFHILIFSLTVEMLFTFIILQN